MNLLLDKLLKLFKNVKDKGFFHLLSANFFVNFFAFGSQLVVAWLLTPTQIGQLKILQTYVSIAVILASCGFEASLLKLSSEKISEFEKKKLFSSASILTFITSLFTLALIVIVGIFFSVSQDETVNEYFAVFLAAAFPLAFNTLNFNFLQGQKKIQLLSKLQTLIKIVSFSLIILLTYLFNIKGFIAATILGYVLSASLLFLKNREYFDLSSILKSFKEYKSKHWSLARFAFLANLVSTSSRFLDIFIINIYIANREEVGQYSFAVNVLLFLQIISDTVQKIVIPYFSEKSSQIQLWLSAFRKYSKIFILVCFALFIFTNLIVESGLTFIFNDKYQESYIFIHILTIRWFFYSLTQFKSSALFGLGKFNINFIGSVVYLILNFLLQMILISSMGTVGVAAAASLAGILYYAFYSWLFKRELKKI